MVPPPTLAGSPLNGATQLSTLPRDDRVTIGTADTTISLRCPTRRRAPASHIQPLRLKKRSRNTHVASRLPRPNTKNDQVEVIPLLTSQPKFIPKNPVMKDSGRKIVPTIASCF